MGARNAPIDPAEWDLAAAQLKDILPGTDGEAGGRDAILRWHLQAVADARSQAWIPGLAGSGEPAVEEALGRFYRHHMRVTIGRLRNENLDLRRKLLEAVACARFYATGAIDAGVRAHRMLERLAPLPAGRAPGAPSRSH